jgi:hypothetical protein
MREGHDTLYLVLLSIFTLTLVKVNFGHFWHKVSIKSLCGDFGDISRLRKLNPKVGYDLGMIGRSHPFIWIDLNH